jgi:ribose transport system permease protein
MSAQQASPPSAPEPEERRRPWFLDPGEVAYRYALVGAWIGVIVLFSLLQSDSFFTVSNFQTIFGSQAVLVVLTLGLVLPLAVGEFDLSIGSVLAFSSVIVAELNVKSGLPVGLACVIAVLAGMAIGAANGFFVVVVGVDALVATLGIGTLVTGIGLGLTNSVVQGGIGHGLTTAISTNLLGLPLGFWYGIGLTLVLWYAFRYTPVGRHLLFVGQGREVARLTGLPVQRIRFGAFVLAGGIAGLAGVISAGTLGAADPNAGMSYLLPAFAAAFLGTTVVDPGRFNPWGSVIAVYFLITAVTGLQLLGLDVWIEQVFYGAALVFAVTLSRIVARRREQSA